MKMKNLVIIIDERISSKPSTKELVERFANRFGSEYLGENTLIISDYSHQNFEVAFLLAEKLGSEKIFFDKFLRKNKKTDDVVKLLMPLVARYKNIIIFTDYEIASKLPELTKDKLGIEKIEEVSGFNYIRIRLSEDKEDNGEIKYFFI